MKVDYNALAKEYGRHRQIHPGVFQNLMLTSALDGASRVLEVGCGTGNYTIAIEKSTGCSCWGVDPSTQMLERARARETGACFALGRAEQLAYPAGFFDLVFSVDVIHHVGDRPAYFREAHRVLKKGGKLCTVTDSEAIIRGRQPLSVYFPETIEVDLQRYPPISDLRAMMVVAGFASLRESETSFAGPLTDIQSYRDKAFSSLHLIPADAFARGLNKLEHDLRAGPVPNLSRYLLLWGTKRNSR